MFPTCACIFINYPEVLEKYTIGVFVQISVFFIKVKVEGNKSCNYQRLGILCSLVSFSSTPGTGTRLTVRGKICAFFCYFQLQTSTIKCKVVFVIHSSNGSTYCTATFGVAEFQMCFGVLRCFSHSQPKGARAASTC